METADDLYVDIMMCVQRVCPYGRTAGVSGQQMRKS